MVALLQLVQAQFQLLWPYWLAGVVLGALLKVGGIEQALTRILAGRAEEKSVGIMIGMGAIGGAVSPFCLYGAMPVLGSLQRSGVPEAAIAAFLVASPLINPNLFVFSLVLGWPLALIRLMTAIVAGTVAGHLVYANWFGPVGFRFGDRCSEAVTSSFSEFVKELVDSAWFSGRFFLLGMVLAAAVDLWVPKTFLMGLLGDSNPVAILAGAFLGIPLYACGGGTIPLLRELLLLGVDPGVVVAFMLAGPATKISNLTAIGAVSGARWLSRYTIFALSGAIMTGYIVHLVWMVWPH